MATKTSNHFRRTRRQRARRVARVVVDNWLLVLVSHTIATIVVLVVERLLHVPPVSGP